VADETTKKKRKHSCLSNRSEHYITFIKPLKADATCPKKTLKISVPSFSISWLVSLYLCVSQKQKIIHPE